MRQGQVDDAVARLRTELNEVTGVLEKVVKEGVGADVVESLKQAVQTLRDEIQGADVVPLTDGVRGCLCVIESNGLAQNHALMLLGAEYGASME